MAQYWVFRIALAAVPRLPMAVARPLFGAIGLLAWAFGGATRRRVERNLRHVPALAANTKLLHDAVRGVFVTSALNYLDLFRGRRLTDQEIYSGWTVENESLLGEAAAEGRGVVLLGAHFGNFEYAASRLGAIGYRAITPAERMEPRQLFELFCAAREHHNMHLVPADSREALREMIEWLKGGGMLLILADRHINGSGARVPFFGEPCTLATAPMALALRTGAPIVVAWSWRTGPGTARGIFKRLTWERPPAAGTVAAATAAAGGSVAIGAGPRTRSASDEVTLALRAYVAQLEEMIAAHPASWVSALAPVWEADAPAAPPSTPTPFAQSREEQPVPHA